MATLYEKYIVDDDTRNIISIDSWTAQTFTPSVNHTITSVKLLSYKDGTPGTVTVGIRNTTAGKPSGVDLCFGTKQGNDLTADIPGLWYEWTFGAGTPLTASLVYAIVVRAAGASFRWRVDVSSPAYLGGSRVYSADAGTGWTIDTNDDQMFEEWGDPSSAYWEGRIALGRIIKRTPSASEILDRSGQERHLFV